MHPVKLNFEGNINGKEVAIFYLSNNDISVAITNYGARVVRCLVPDKNGAPVDIVVGFKSIEDYKIADCPYYGAVVGRYANRIAKGKFSLAGKSYQLELNNGPNALHGGTNGFHDRVWDAVQQNESSVELKYSSEDGEEGYPGRLTTKVSYALTEDNELQMKYELTTDKTTIANITNHNFWNLNGEGSGDILGHELKIEANQFNKIDSTSIPVSIGPVENTAFDFTTFHTIGERINADDQQLKFGKGYDHNFVLNKGLSASPELIAIAKGDVSGIVMKVYTTEPGLQFYSGNFMEGKDTFKSGARDEYRTAFCLETQHFPDSPNHPDYPTTELNPGEVYTSTTIYKFK